MRAGDGHGRAGFCRPRIAGGTPPIPAMPRIPQLHTGQKGLEQNGRRTPRVAGDRRFRRERFDAARQRPRRGEALRTRRTDELPTRGFSGPVKSTAFLTCVPPVSKILHHHRKPCEYSGGFGLRLKAGLTGHSVDQPPSPAGRGLVEATPCFLSPHPALLDTCSCIALPPAWPMPVSRPGLCP